MLGLSCKWIEKEKNTFEEASFDEKKKKKITDSTHGINSENDESSSHIQTLEAQETAKTLETATTSDHKCTRKKPLRKTKSVIVFSRIKNNRLVLYSKKFSPKRKTLLSIVDT